MAVYANDQALGFPPPAHTMTAGAELARQAVRRFAHERNLEKASASMVTRHGTPKFVAAPAAAERFRSLAQAKGFEVRVALGRRDVNVGKRNEASQSAWTVAGMDRARGIGFRAVWVNGKAAEGSWYDANGEAECGVGELAKRVRAL